MKRFTLNEFQTINLFWPHISFATVISYLSQWVLHVDVSWAASADDRRERLYPCSGRLNQGSLDNAAPLTGSIHHLGGNVVHLNESMTVSVFSLSMTCVEHLCTKKCRAVQVQIGPSFSVIPLQKTHGNTPPNRKSPSYERPTLFRYLRFASKINIPNECFC
jgi:hypothetical protein